MSQHSLKRQNIKVIILVGSRDFGRCPLASRLPIALWPIVGKPVLERLLRHLSRQGIKQAVICSSGDGELLQSSIDRINSMQIKFLDRLLPVGTAGCIRDAADADTDVLFLVLHAGIVSPPNIDMLIRTHRTAKSDLTVVFKPDPGKDNQGSDTSGIYICEPTVLEYIPQEGYCDIKEGLIPAMVRAGKTVHAVTLSRSAGDFRDRAGYLAAIANYLDNNFDTETDFSRSKCNGSKDTWLANGAMVDPSARIFGPTVIMDGATVSERVIIFGPTIIGRNVTVDKDTIVENSVLWGGSSIGRNCEINSCVVDYNAVVPDNSIVQDEAVISGRKSIFKNGVNSVASLANGKMCQLHSLIKPLVGRINTKLPGWAQFRQLRPNALQGLGIGVLVSVFLWSYWPELVDLWNIWQRSDEYSCGLLVPFLAIYILWAKREKIKKCRIKPSIWGLFAFIAAQALRYFGLYYWYSSAERLSMVLSVASLTLFLFGWQVFRKTSSVLLFLFLMLPLPRRVHGAVMLPLQNLATVSAVFCLEMIGYAVKREGNIIHLNDTTVAVLEACNGLRMVTAFFVIIGLVVLLVRRAWWEKLIVLISSLPIALLCNTVRLTITAVVFTVLTGKEWEKIFHDFGGYAMMPLALAMVILELGLLTKLTTVHGETKQQLIIRDSNS